MTTVISFMDRGDVLNITVEQGFSATDFNLYCKDQEHRDKMAIDALIAITNNFFKT